MGDTPARFAWYELMTTDIAAAKAFYAEVVGWGTQDASTPDLAYSLFTAEGASVSGLMELPQDARKMGATPRWMGYVGCSDVDATAEQITRLGGAVYVAPTDSNVGRIAVVADPQMVSLALVTGLKPRPPAPRRAGQAGARRLARIARRRRREGVCLLSGDLWLAEGGDRNRCDGDLSIVRRRRPDDRRHVHQTSDRAV